MCKAYMGDLLSYLDNWYSSKAEKKIIPVKREY